MANVTASALRDPLKAQLTDLRSRYDECRGSIPVNCDASNAAAPDGKPVLKEACEKMHAKRGRMFEGTQSVFR